MPGARKIVFGIFTFLFVFNSALVFPQSSAATPAAQSQPCTEPQQKQIDFWVGTWDLTWPAQKHGEIDHGTNTIKRLFDDCVVEENFSGGDSSHLRGMSVSIFVASVGKWQQTWVDNEGSYLEFVGEFKDGQMVLSREASNTNGTKMIQRMVFKNITAAEFDWSWEGSNDGGKTWNIMWPIHYKRH